MPTAIRIDKIEILHSERHIDLVLKYRDREKLTDDQMDEMIEAGRIEFGAVFWDSKANSLEWSGDETRDNVYDSMYQLYWVGGPAKPRR